MENDKYYVYEHSINGQFFYVGSIWVFSNPVRAYETIKRNKEWHKFVNKNNGKFDIKIVKYFETSKEAVQYEHQLIYKYHDLGLAQASKEDWRGRKHSEKSKKKMSLSKQNMYIGENNPMYGKSIKDYMSEEKYEQWRINNSQSKIGRKLTDQQKKDISNRQKGSNNHRAIKVSAILPTGKIINKDSSVELKNELEKEGFNIPTTTINKYSLTNSIHKKTGIKFYRR